MKRRVLCFFGALVLLAGLMLPAAGAGAESVLDVYAVGRFDGNYPVYTGPGDFYVRADNGNAIYKGAQARIYGVVDDWVLISFPLTSRSDGDHRMGYISADALNHIKYVDGEINYWLSFKPYIAYADDYCRVTDDPIMNQKMMYTIPEGTAVTVLCTMGNPFTYVEVDTKNGPLRGFVWSKHLTGYNPYDPIPVYTARPTAVPTARPTARPTAVPTARPTARPTAVPTARPTATPNINNIYYHDSNRGQWLPTPQTVTLVGSWPVYSGPETYYYRANEGRATVGGGACQVYGVDKSWVMIGYTLSNGSYRIGYVSTSALPKLGLYIPYLDLTTTSRRLRVGAALTDDPVRYRPTVATLTAGTYVLFLGYTWEGNQTWAYVEVLANGSIMRGFIPASCLE